MARSIDKYLYFAFAFIGFISYVVNACTTIAVTANATLDKVAMTIHTTDCEECDSRLALVPGKKHKPGAKHHVFGIAGAYPRQTSDRAYIYQPEIVPKEWHVKPLRTIPEVAYTYGVWESTYTLMNEMGLTFGESSCTSKIIGTGVDMPDPLTGKPGEAYFSIAALMRLGLERCATAVCAVETMGSLAEKYGFYGESLYGAEALSIADTTGDAWIFHVLQTYTTNTSAIWAAQRVPKGHMAVVANEFTIQEIPLNTHDDYRFSSNMVSEAIAAGFISEKELGGKFNFQRVYGTKSTLGENYYATIRQHWLYSQVAPSLNLKLEASPSKLPFSVRVERPIDVEYLMNLFRDHYQGTDHDLTKGILAGPFGNPKRIEGGAGLKQVNGQFARGISITRTSHTHLGFAHPTDAACFYSPDEPQSSVFAPFFVSLLKDAASLPLKDTTNLYSDFFQKMRRDQFSRESAWWAFDVVANWMNLNFKNMSEEIVQPAVKIWQRRMIEVYKSKNRSLAVQAQDSLVMSWWELFEKLIVKYNDGTYNFFAPGIKRGYERIGYPVEYLRDIHFDGTFWKSVTFNDQIRKVCHSSDNNSTSQATANLTLRERGLLILGILIGVLLSTNLQRMFAFFFQNQWICHSGRMKSKQTLDA